MSLFRWLFSAAKPAKPRAESADLSRMDATRGAAKRHGGPVQPGSRKSERMVRREMLYGVVRDAMMRSGVLSASYKFKVLSLDARGRQFLVMVDLARGAVARPAEIEALIAQRAKSRHDIAVSGVYWRTSERFAAVENGARPHARESDSQPVPADPPRGALASGPAPLESKPAPLAPAAAPRTSSPYEPIQADEVAAFKRALASGVENPAAAAAASVGVAHGASARSFDGSGMHGPQSYTLLTGFEDTEMPDEQRRSALSGTQHGDLH